MDKPTYVTLDPEHKVLFKFESKLADPMYREMIESADLFTKIHAYGKLAKSGKRKNIEALGEVYDKEAFPWLTACLNN